MSYCAAPGTDGARFPACIRTNGPRAKRSQSFDRCYVKDYVDRDGENIASVLCLREDKETRMTDHGFRKFRRRRKREETPAQDVVRSASTSEPSTADRVSVNRPSADRAPADQSKPSVKEASAPVTPVRPTRPSRPSPAEVETDVHAETRESLTARRSARRFQPADDDTSVAASRVARQPASSESRPEQDASVTPAAQIDIAPPSQREANASLPAALPDPWHIMRHVEVTGLNERRSRLPLVDFFRSSPTARAFDLLRTRMLHSLRAHGWKRVAVCGPTPGCGASFTAANLALSLARVPNSRTVLMDMNLRNPGIARSLGLERSALYNGDMLGFLRGEIRLEEHLVAASDRLALGLNTSTFHNAAEVLHETRCASIIDDLVERTRADVVLFDLPPVLHNDDVAAFLPQVDGVLLVSDGSQTTARHLKACEKMLAGHTQLLGVVLNRARNEDEFSGGA